MDQLGMFLEEPRKYTLNEGQQVAFDWLVDFCLNNGKNGYRKVLLNGYAGTGKSFLINRVVEEVRRQWPSMNFGMTAPTHKAVRVLKRSSELRKQLDFGTIHSFLGLKEAIDYATGKVSYKPSYDSNRERKIDSIHVLIIDESSMLNDDLFEHIETEMRSNGSLLVIYMGDEKQIPPVGKKQSTGESNAIPFLSVRQQSHRIYVLSLTEPQRQAKESPIIMYSVAIREQSQRQKIAFDFTEEMREHLELIPPKTTAGVSNLPLLRQIFLQYFRTPEFEADQDYVKVIAWRNTTVDYFNKEIRLLLNDAVSLPRIIDNEKLIMDAPLIGDKKVILLHNNDEVVTRDVTLGEVNLEYKIFPNNPIAINQLLERTGIDHYKRQLKVKVYKCTLLDEDKKFYKVNILHEDSEKEYNEAREIMKNAALKHIDKWQRTDLWQQYYRIEENFAWVKHNYAITGHKSQGSTYQYTISMEWDIEVNTDIEERNRIRYVAATRAKEKLIVVK